MWNIFHCRAHYRYYSHTHLCYSSQVTEDLHNAGATLLTGVVLFDSSYRGAWFGDVGRELPWKPQGCLCSQTHTQTHEHSCSQGCSDRLVSLCSSHQHSSLPSVSAACLRFPLIITSSSPVGHASWNGFPHIGHYHVMKECYYYPGLFAPLFIKAEGEKADRCIPWYVVHSVNCTRESFSLHPLSLHRCRPYASCTSVTRTRLFCMMLF